MVSSASDRDKGGKIDGSLFANIDFPAPGGPIRIILCPPAAAISIALLTCSWPLTSEKSKSYFIFSSVFSSLLLYFIGVSSNFPSRKSTTSVILLTPYISNPSTTAASFALAIGRINPLYPSFFAIIAIGSAPLIGRIFPSSESSPIII